MKTVVVNPDIRVPGIKNPRMEETIIEAEDVLSEEVDPVEFSVGEELEVRFVDSHFTTVGIVTKLHEDPFGALVQVYINWDKLKPLD